MTEQPEKTGAKTEKLDFEGSKSEDSGNKVDGGAAVRAASREEQ